MPSFKFRLEPVLTARKREEQGVQLEVAALERERLKLEETLRRFQEEISRGRDSLRGSLTGVIDMRSLRMGAGASLHAVRKAHQVVLQLAGVMQRLEATRERLLEATKRRRALELLRERRLDRWKTALDKAETAALDELAVMRAGATQRETPP